MFYGLSGMGKSSLAKCLAKKHPTLYINVGENGTIDVLRTKISRFCEEIPMNLDQYESDIKVVILDEVGMKSSMQFYEGLKGLMDTYSSNVRFIATTNYIQLLPDSMKSRFELINFGFESSAEKDLAITGYKKRTKAIIKALQTEISDESLDLLVDICFPDFRKSLQLIQKMYISGIKNITSEHLNSSNYEFKSLYDLIIDGDVSKPEMIHELLMGTYANSAHEVLTALDDNFINYLIKSKNSYCKFIPEILVAVAKYNDMANRVDPSLAMKSCVYVLMELMRRK